MPKQYIHASSGKPADIDHEKGFRPIVEEDSFFVCALPDGDGSVQLSTVDAAEDKTIGWLAPERARRLAEQLLKVARVAESYLPGGDT